MTRAAGARTDEAQLPLLARVVDQVGDGLAVVVNDRWFALVNPAFAENLGRPALTTVYSPDHQGRTPSRRA